MQITLIGLDLAKNIIQVCGINRAGKSVFNRAVKRHKLFQVLAQHPGVPVAMEACSGSNYWGREVEKRGHQALLIPPQHVKPFVKGNKNDRNDAFAVCEAAHRPRMVFVSPRTLAQTDLLLSHKIRDRLVAQRTTLTNQIRGLLQEYGIVLPQRRATLRRELPLILEDADNSLTPQAREYFALMLEEWRQLEDRIAKLEQDIKRQCRASEDCQRLTGIYGVGEVTATAMVAFVGDASHYRSSRHLASCLGVVPREFSSGGKQSLGSITKRGNRYLRYLLVQCGWSIISRVGSATDRLSCWARKLIERRGKQRAAVALANKLARIIWAMLTRKTDFQAV